MAWGAGTGRSGNAAGAGASLATSATVAVATGDLVVGWFKYEAAGLDAGVSISDGGTNTYTITDHVKHSSANLEGGWFYKIGATAVAAATFTLNTPANPEFRRICVYVFTPDSGDTVSLLDAVVGGGSGTGLSSGNITVSGTDIVALGANGEFNNITLASRRVASTASEGNVDADDTSLWYIRRTSGFTDDADASQNPNTDEWLCGIIAFESAGAGGGDTRGTPIGGDLLDGGNLFRSLAV